MALEPAVLVEELNALRRLDTCIASNATRPFKLGCRTPAPLTPAFAASSKKIPPESLHLRIPHVADKLQQAVRRVRHHRLLRARGNAPTDKVRQVLKGLS